MFSEKIHETKQFLLSKLPAAPELALVLGSGLGGIAEKVENPVRIGYSQIPNFMRSTVEGHKGELVAGRLFGKDAVIMQGRLHFYEGYTLGEVTFPIRLMSALGIKTLILTSAVGGINKKYRPGEMVLIKDHINCMKDNPLRGPHESGFGERFPDMAEIYTPEYRRILLEIARKKKITVREGVYIAVSGPSYETPAEIRAYRSIGADVVGMSVVPEAIVAKQSGLKVVCISYIANMGAGVNREALSHNDVLEMGSKAVVKMEELLREFFGKI
jgi:purine-nucleoside phosphorylase